MKKWKRILLIGLGCFFAFMGNEKCILAEENTDVYQQELEELQQELDTSELDAFLEETEYRDKVTFKEIVRMLLEGETDASMLLQWLLDAVFYEVEQNRQMMMELIVLVFAFSLLHHFTGIWEKSYFTDISFVFFYCVLAVLLLKSLVVMGDVVTDTLEKSVDFIQAFIPTYCFTMIFSSKVSSSVGFYQTSYILIYLIQFLFQHFLVALIHTYVLMELLSHFFEEERFEGMVELLKNFIEWCLKLASGIILGLNVVQGLISPVRDKLAGGTAARVVSVFPGVGNAINGVTELILGTGILLKNCVGIAGVMLFAIFCVLPLLQIGCMVLFYQLAGAVVQPVADKRIYGCLKGVARGGVLYLKTIGTSILLFVLTIALTTAATSFF